MMVVDYTCATIRSSMPNFATNLIVLSMRPWRRWIIVPRIVTMRSRTRGTSESWWVGRFEIPASFSSDVVRLSDVDVRLGCRDNVGLKNIVFRNPMFFESFFLSKNKSFYLIDRRISSRRDEGDKVIIVVM